MTILNTPEQDGGIEGDGHKQAKIKVAETLSAAGYTVEYEAKFWVMKNQKKPFRVDVYLPDYQICVECDGDTHNSRRAKSKDRWKDECLESAGFNVIRIAVDEAFGAPEQILPRLPRPKTSQAV
jgi:hypothetical protein